MTAEPLSSPAVAAVEVLPTCAEAAATAVGTPEQIERLEELMLAQPHLELPVQHQFAPGIYMRVLTVPPGCVVIGHEHRRPCLNILMKGRISLMIDGEIRQLRAPASFVSEAGVRKVAYVHEEMVWANIHPNPDDERDPAILEERHIVRSAAWLRHHDAMKLITGDAQP